jgi:hypothetical protein
MAKKILILFLFISTFFLHGQDAFTIKNEKYLFSSKFVESSFMVVNLDSLIFKISSDTATVGINRVQTKNNDMIWILYKNHGNMDFWEVYCRQFHYDKDDYEKTPKELISRYFKDKKIHLENTLIYIAAIKPQITTLCGMCYNWTDFLFKIKAADLKKLSELTGQKFEIVSNVR